MPDLSTVLEYLVGYLIWAVIVTTIAIGSVVLGTLILYLIGELV